MVNTSLSSDVKSSLDISTPVERTLIIAVENVDGVGYRLSCTAIRKMEQLMIPPLCRSSFGFVSKIEVFVCSFSYAS